MKIVKVCIFICLLTTGVSAKNLELQSSQEDMAELEKLMTIMNKYSDLATKTRMNADFVPGILTVVSRQEMEIAGFKTVEDVLKSMAGIHVYIDTVGMRKISIRGIGGATASGNVKLMLNKIPMIDSLASLSDVLLDFPTSLIERIEIIRGPGSAIYGEYAYTGVINIITRKKNSSVSLGIESLATFSSSAMLNYHSKECSSDLNIMAYQYKTDGSDAITGPDAYYTEVPDRKHLSLAPGSTNETQIGKTVLLSLKHCDTTLSAYMAQVYRGDFMGYYHYLYNLRDFTPHKIRQHTLQLSHTINLNPQLKLTIKGGSQKYRFFLENYYLFPPGYGMPYISEGIELINDSIEKKYYANFDLSYHINNHRFLLGFEHISTKFLSKSTFVNLEVHRHIYSLISQYEYQPIDRFTLTLGLRYDNYDDDYENYEGIDNNFSPRISGVYRLSTNHIFKCQFQKAFRPASFGEMTYNVKAPKISTSELSYTYKSSFTRGRINLYHSILKDLIQSNVQAADALFIYYNSRKIRSRGCELELEHQLFQPLKISTNAAFMYTKNLDTDMSMPLQTDFIGNAGIIYSPLPIVNMSMRYRYLGNRTREVGDNRSELAGYHKLDMSMMFHAPRISTKIRLGIDNVLNEDIKVPTTVAHIFHKEQTYPGDFPRKGRTMWFDIAYEF
jgi:iron complex outermembrane receptor protein